MECVKTHYNVDYYVLKIKVLTTDNTFTLVCIAFTKPGQLRKLN